MKLHHHQSQPILNTNITPALKAKEKIATVKTEFWGVKLKQKKEEAEKLCFEKNISNNPSFKKKTHPHLIFNNHFVRGKLGNGKIKKINKIRSENYLPMNQLRWMIVKKKIRNKFNKDSNKLILKDSQVNKVDNMAEIENNMSLLKSWSKERPKTAIDRGMNMFETDHNFLRKIIFNLSNNEQENDKNFENLDDTYLKDLDEQHIFPAKPNQIS